MLWRLYAHATSPPPCPPPTHTHTHTHSPQEIIVFRKQQLSYYGGNYDEYVAQVEERQLHQQRLADGIERKREHMEKRWEGGWWVVGE